MTATFTSTKTGTVTRASDNMALSDETNVGGLGLGRGLNISHADPITAGSSTNNKQTLTISFNRAVTFLGHQREKLKELAATDPLTGLINHRSLHETLRSEIEHVQKAGGSLGVVAVDLDGFRQVNEELGHARGDETLKAVGAALGRSVRDTAITSAVSATNAADIAMISAKAGIGEPHCASNASDVTTARLVRLTTL